MKCEPLSYHPDSSRLFQSIAQQNWAMFLDSAQTENSRWSRYDILAATPRITLTTRGTRTEIQHWQAGKTTAPTQYSQVDPFLLLQRILRAHQSHKPPENFPRLPFYGGAMGYFGYDLGRTLENLPVTETQAETQADTLPDMAIGIYDWAVVIDHQLKQSWLVGKTDSEAHWQALYDCFNQTAPIPAQASPLHLQTPLHSTLEQQAYFQAFQKIQDWIYAGDCYQVNFARCFSAKAATDSDDPWAAYVLLRQKNPAPFSAYINLPDGQILSASPERFLQLRQGRVETCPIKGTRPRHIDAVQDQLIQTQLKNSEKDRAENLMIVDLLRNDLGKVCIPGSIKVPDLFALENFATVHHLVSTITGQLQHDEDAVTLLRACFPGGSITGAPKHRAMQIIDTLEPAKRGIYCGTIGYLGYDGQMDSNIAIRTLSFQQGQIQCWAGGGIVADSEAQAEYQETLDKLAGLLLIFDM
ncbi:aminodeoxychorismate synthase component I [Candidatus Venteria ishoeyi]|uniref:aminodeoxychorismate synthase component I n=1 Tax=Candidatus Venteria ishoeyi TaxID=1899563 RepID=UPI0025A67BE6|nr:aminodeoxychorismate synthase component I [Candidatus Venteria ishoeyi]MDM8547439.1 aminodeoxychorismate synthase component I [Candidatus Venteria ishoeyi]